MDGHTGQVEYAFENAEKILGIKPQNLGRLCRCSGSFYETLCSVLKERIDEKTVKTIPVYNDRLSRQMWIQIAALPVKLLGELKYIFAVTDVTHDRQIRENLNAAVAAAEQCQCIESVFLSNMSHDIRTPMNAIVGNDKAGGDSREDREKVKGLSV